MRILKMFLLVGFSLLCLQNLMALDPLNASQKAKVEAQLEALKVLGQDPAVVKAVLEANTNPPASNKTMTQDIWKALSILSAEIKTFSKNPIIDYLKTKKTDLIVELFINAADGTKVGFFAKTSSWIHKGKPKHDLPMQGKTWIGEPEQDESTGKIQVQIAFPVIEKGKAIGSIVIGLELGKL